MKRNEILENLVYAGIWFMLLLTPIISLLIRMSTDSNIQFSWNEVFDSWRLMVPFLVVFVLHNFVMARLLVYHHKVVLYISLTVAMLVVFQLVECQHRPRPFDHGEHPEWARGPDHRSYHPKKDNADSLPSMAKPPENPAFCQDRPDDRHHPQEPPSLFPDQNNRHPKKGMDHPPLLSNGPVLPLLVLLLMLGLNLGIKYFFKSRQEAKKMEALQRAHLEQQLEYLKYQVNPHFFMNTLNNIHALVDIDPEQAKETILELSKLMRYVLYEGAKDWVPLQKDVSFIQNYVTLMRLRYTDRVKIEMEIAALPERKIPPMILITFVENAFKHGVSYRTDSFIHIHLHHNEGRLYFTCSNSRHGQERTESGGVGLRNVKERLQLLFGNDYTLDTEESDDRYEVRLDFPTYE